MIFSLKRRCDSNRCAASLARWSSFELSCAIARGATINFLDVAIGDLAGVAFAASDDQVAVLS
jgi:hypothetical protein